MLTSPIHSHVNKSGVVVLGFIILAAILVIHFLIVRRVARPLFIEKGYKFDEAKRNASWIALISVLLFTVLGLIWSWVITLIIMFIVRLILHEVNNDRDYGNDEKYDFGDDYKDKLSSADELRKWKKLMDDGIISEEEFNRKKENLLRR